MVNLVELTQSPAWIVPDIYFEPFYGHLDARASGATWYAIGAADGTWSLPVVESRRDERTRMAVSPYGYAGIHVDPALNFDAAHAFWLDAVDQLCGRGVVSLFLRFDPLTASSAEVAREFAGLQVLRSSTTYAVSITDVDSMWTRMEGRARTEVRKAAKSGMSAQILPVDPPVLSPGSAFRELYSGTMERVGAADRYFFNDDYFATLAVAEPGRVNIAQVKLGDEIVASAIILRHGTRAHYHLSGSSRDAARLGANSLMLWSVMEWCAEQNVEVFHLGGGLTEGDSLARFKRSFSDQHLDFFTGRAVINPVKYDQLTRQQAANLGVSVEALEKSGYFPAFLAEV